MHRRVLALILIACYLLAGCAGRYRTPFAEEADAWSLDGPSPTVVTSFRD